MHALSVLFVFEVALNAFEKILLARLPEHEAIQREPFFELVITACVLTVTVEEQMPANALRRAVFGIKYPVRVETVLVTLHPRFGVDGGENALPEVTVTV